MASRLTMAALLLAALGIGVLALAAPAPLRADPLEFALRSLHAADTSLRVGDYSWLENDGLAVKLAPAPLAAPKGLALLATDVRAGRASVALWRLDSRGMAPLVKQLGANVQATRDFSTISANDVAVSGKQTEFTLTIGVRGQLSVFTLGRVEYALVITAPGGVGDDLAQRRDETLAQIYVVIAPEEGLLAPLLVEGRFAGRLKGYARNGRRFEMRAPRGWISASLLTVAGGEFGSRDALQFELEQRLKAQGLRRTGGDTPSGNWGIEMYCGQYFTQGHITRIVYAKLGDDFLVAVFHGHESARELLEQESMSFGKSLRPTGLPQNAPPPRPTLSQAGTMEISAWQEGTTLHWGALFERPWRENNVAFEAKISQNGKTLTSASGAADSSLEFNPLGPNPRTLNLLPEFKGEVLLDVRVGTLSASLRVTLR